MGSKTPEKVFYYHYKHDPAGEVNNYAYEVLNIAHHTEMEDFDENAFVIYRPIYESSVYKLGAYLDARPLTMFMERVVKDGKEMDRFTKITDPATVSVLEKIRDKMYENFY